MVNYIYCDPSFNNNALLTDYKIQLNQFQACVEVTSLSQLEQNVLKGNGSCLIFLTNELQPLQQAFIERLLSNTALPIIVNAQHWDENHLASLLLCGRVTFVPEQLSAKRLSSLVNLAKIRFDNASNMLEKVKQLDEKCVAMKLVSKAKSLLQLQGISEKVAHELIQKQAMSKGVTVAEMAKSIIAAAKQIEANQRGTNRMQQFGASAPVVTSIA
ncbi:ANTAR domain-containing response regulator [Shewanella sp. 10N.286.48.B5]|uniref:ANTAR domain-containing response regulator n=1 Tax=Shewanella sp. 10N.286.48.B5 TaxID=1880834 RepID=UPI000C82A6CF|nr:ANTAR domain-containing protein [Shewanella sp. 10N.286.48.B5]PMH87201.1 hypothetical protein BCU57_07765 [Shewanella sp. 10N.286.48.B5]